MTMGVGDKLPESHWFGVRDQVEALREKPRGAAWYIVRSVGKSDHQVLDVLKKLKITTYYPIVLEMRKVAKRFLAPSQRGAGIVVRKPQPAPLFPRYIFTNFDMAQPDWREMFKFAGVGGMVCEGDLPVWVPDSLIDHIKEREHNGIIPGETATRVVFGIGDDVVVTDGPFASFPGIVERGLDCSIGDLDPLARIKVAVNIFGRATPVELEVWQVNKRQAD